jgi:DNA-binding GntR family transcriptional regulator
MNSRNSVFEPPLLLGNQIFNFMREQIISGKLKEGSRLNELSLQKMFKISRSPIREAFRRLEVEGLVEIVPRKGAFVRSICMEDLREATEVRSCLEAKALRLAEKCITPDHLDILSKLLRKMEEKLRIRDIKGYTILHSQFHKALVAMSGNQYLMRLHSMVTEPFVTDRVTYMYLKRLAHADEVSHRKIYELLASGKTTEASRLIEDHISFMYSDYVQLNADGPGQSNPRILKSHTKGKKS